MGLWFLVRWAALMTAAYIFTAYTLWDAAWLFNVGALSVSDRGGIAFSIVGVAVIAFAFSLMLEF